MFKEIDLGFMIGAGEGICSEEYLLDVRPDI